MAILCCLILYTAVAAITSVAHAASSSVATLPASVLAPTAAATEPWRSSLYWQNDGSFAKPNHSTDRHYTDGQEVSFSYDARWARRLARHMPFARRFHAKHTAAGFALGQLIFTPANIQTTQPQLGDRPYAGYLFTSAYLQRSNAHAFDQIELELGIVGPDALGRQVQNTVHDLRGLATANGWSNQLQNEVTGEIYLRREWRFDLPTVNLGARRIETEVIPRAEADVGTVYRQAVGGALIRTGVNLPDDFGPGQLRDIADAPGRPAHGLSAYVFVGLRGIAVEHDLFLQGNTFRDSLSVQPKPVVRQAQGGIAVAYAWHKWFADLVYGQTFFSQQFYGQNGTDAFGSVTLAAGGRF